ncbi:uncharacterized protein LOC111618357 isoform X2 [Centruroides sculpturatus]|uniref:uncharacterized protein LOC111618357 isoform X2 n=1 Tax=Centruroides sculpturatus TaxID=218467 RepID=UPI000C6DC854|nr:uncharacterized protein LOC111618357 isoform X2 [Centruroides sculpturatus]
MRTLTKMVRNYKRKKNDKYDQETLRRAIQYYRDEKVSLNSVSKKYGIPRTTLQYWMKKEFQAPGIQNKGRFRHVFMPEHTTQLKHHVMTLQKMFYGISTVDFRRLAFQYAKANNLQHPFNEEKKMAGPDWLANFMKKENLSLRTPEGMSMSRIMGFTREKVNKFFEIFQQVKIDNNIPAERIFNMDEIGVSNVQTPKKFLATRGLRQIDRITSADKGRNITVVGTISAAGTFLPPMVIYPRTRINPNLLFGSFPGTAAYAAPSGWMDVDLFLKYIGHFIKYVRPSMEAPVILILDGHASHKSLGAINLCRDNGIKLITLPPHTSNKMQPLDVAIYGPFKTYLYQEIDKYMTNYPGVRITDFTMGPLIKEAYIRAFAPENIMKGFQRSGISPYNPDIFQDDDFMGASAVLNSRNTTFSIAVPSAPVPIPSSSELLPSSSSSHITMPTGESNSSTENEMILKVSDISPLPKPKEKFPIGDTNNNNQKK